MQRILRKRIHVYMMLVFIQGCLRLGRTQMNSIRHMAIHYATRFIGIGNKCAFAISLSEKSQQQNC